MGDGLHVVIGQAFGIQDHGEWVAGASTIGEDIGLHVGAQAAGEFCRRMSVPPAVLACGRPMSSSPNAVPWMVLKFGGTSVSSRLRWDNIGRMVRIAGVTRGCWSWCRHCRASPTSCKRSRKA